MFDLKNAPAWLQLVAFGLLMALSTTIFAFFGTLGGLAFWSPTDIVAARNLSIIHTSTQLDFLRFFHGITHFGLWSFPPIFFCFMISQNFWKYYYFTKNEDFLKFIGVFFLVFLSLPITGILTEINAQMKLPEFLVGIENWMKDKEELAANFTKEIVNVKSMGGLATNLLIMAVLPAIGEELLFRGVLLRFTYRFTKKIHLSVFIIAFLFSAIHIQFYGFLPRFVLGLILGYLFIWTKSMWMPILFHFLNNAMAVIVFYLSAKGSFTADPDKVGTTQQSYLWLILIPAFGYLVYWFYKNRVEENIFEEAGNIEEKLL